MQRICFIWFLLQVRREEGEEKGAKKFFNSIRRKPFPVRPIVVSFALNFVTRRELSGF